MIVENNWISHNLQDRLQNKNSDFVLSMTPYNFTPKKGFRGASLKAIRSIGKKYNNLFLNFSGGADSEYVFRLLIEEKIPFTPITVISPNNYDEARNALDLYKQYPELKPVIIRVTEKEILDFLYNELYQKLGSIGYNAVFRLIGAKYAFDHGGKIIMGETLIDLDLKRTKICEWDFYSDVLFGPDFYIPFYLYNIELVQQILLRLQKTKNKKENVFKCKIYKIKNRKKSYPRYSEKFQKVVDELEKKQKTEINKRERVFCMSPVEFLSILKPFENDQKIKP
jgi:hypothetical protein